MRIIAIGVLIHLLFLISVFDIYFKSPLIHGMAPQKSERPAPARRLVLFVADGLSAESMYGVDYKTFPHQNVPVLTPYLRSLITNEKATWGISHTHVPTESRPGHVALTAGFYEDPSAIANGWKENPVEFDSVFNESRYTWAWGSPDIVRMFAKSPHVSVDYYDDSDEDFSGKISTISLDSWVFDKVTLFFQAMQNEDMKKVREDKVIFFLHLLGLDTAGHVHKPYSKQHHDNLMFVDEGVKKVVTIINNYFKDNLTAFIFTSDHGMTSWGAHGAGTKVETETPFIAWGPGIASSTVEINQADIAPFISTLIGIPIPINSIGVLPITCLRMSLKDTASAMYTNARQIYMQYNEKRKKTEENSLKIFYRPYNFINEETYDILIKEAINNNNFDFAISKSLELIELALNGLEYYQYYYKNLLLICITLTYIGWIFLLIMKMYAPTYKNVDLIYENKRMHNNVLMESTIIYLLFFISMFITSILLFVQSLPFMFYIYINVPLCIYSQIVVEYRTWFSKYMKYGNPKQLLKNIMYIVIFIFGVEMLIISFTERAYLSILLIVISVWPYNLKKINLSLKLCWSANCICLSVFPYLPVVGSLFNPYLMCFAAVLWIITNIVVVILAKIRVFSILPRIDNTQITICGLQTLIIFIIHVNQIIVNENFNNKIGLTNFNQFISCLGTVIALVLPLFGSQILILRLINLMMGFIVPFLLLSVSYEPIFMWTLFMNMIIGLIIDNFEYLPLGQSYFLVVQFDFKLGSFNFTKQKVDMADYRRGFYILLISVLAFFGMGNMDSINSFDPAWVRNYISVFSPFIMMSLILFKIAIPYIIICCVLRALTVCLHVSVNKVFNIVLIFCDIMGVQFLYKVKNTGSWLEIGTSISHFVISQAIVLFLLLLYASVQYLTDTVLAKYLIRKKIHKKPY